MGMAKGAGSWRRIDPRLVAGILLVVASVLGVWGLLASQSRSVQVYVARTTLVPGERVRAADLQLTDVRLSGVAAYASREDLPPDAVVLRTVPRGELVPVTALGRKAEAGYTSIVVKASGPVAAAVTAGATVDVWAARPSTAKEYAPPSVLASSATVVSVLHDDALVTDRGSVSVEVRMPASRVAAVLQAAADGQSLSVVPARESGR
jgi:hypothetical protein